MARPIYLALDFSALTHNLERVRCLAPKSRIIAMVKANAYGHGLVPVAKVLAAGVDMLGVAGIDEALVLREASVNTPILLLEGAFSGEELALAVEYELELVIHQEEQLCWLEQAILPKPLKVWLKIDTGMHRLGCSKEEAAHFYERLLQCRQVNADIGLMTHFAVADLENDPFTQLQMSSFESITHSWTGPKSLANSAAIMAWPQTQADYVRPGLMLYGISPFSHNTAVDLGLKPVMTFRTELIAVHQCKQNDTIGYGRRYTCPAAMPIGVVAAGYGDGYPRHAKNGTPILVNGVRVPLIGTVSMDMLMVDLRPLKQANVGDSVTLWGEGLPVEEVAYYADTIPYELVSRIMPRVRRIQASL